MTGLEAWAGADPESNAIRKLTSNAPDLLIELNNNIYYLLVISAIQLQGHIA